MISFVIICGTYCSPFSAVIVDEINLSLVAGTTESVMIDEVFFCFYLEGKRKY